LVVMAERERAAVDAIVRRLESAWNAMDSEAFAAEFSGDADYVNIAGEHMRGRAAIAAGHHAIFRDFYADSTARMTVTAVRLLAPDVALAHVHSELDVPKGPLAGHNTALFSAVLTRRENDHGERWEIAAFHNTRQMARGRKPPADEDVGS
jgi:uncharacterized protein (TIGR02246 family)